MTVTELQPVSKTRTRVVIDEETTLVLSNKDLYVYNLTEGEDIPETVWAEMMADLRQKALQKCGKLLMGMDYSRKGLTDKLVRGGFPADIAEEAADRMEEAGYLDDRRMAEGYLKYHIQDRSLARIRQDLQQKGVSRDLVEEVIQEWILDHADTLREGERGQILHLLEKRHFDPNEADYTEVQKSVMYLMQKGYQPSDIRAVMQELMRQDS